MSLKLAIQPDRVVHGNGDVQSFSERWHEIAALYGITTRTVDVYDRHALSTISKYDGFMWRCPPDAQIRHFAQRLFAALELSSQTHIFPNWSTRWHFEDKISQTYVLGNLGVPIPETTIVWDREQALQYVDNATYPLVLKLSSGFQSRNVRLIRNVDEARYYVEQLFIHGLTTLAYDYPSRTRRFLRTARQSLRTLAGNPYHDPGGLNEIHRGYLYIQEFIPDNAYDTRITVIGDRAFGFVRSNRPNDFRASGSGQLDWNPEGVDTRMVNLAFKISRELRSQTVAIDFVKRDDEILVLELTLTYASWAVRDCPGHWKCSEAMDGELEWIDGSMRPEDALFEDFVREMSM